MARRDSHTQMMDLNQRILDQNNQIKQITRVAEATKDTSNNVLKQLGDQRGKIERNIDMSKEINKELQYTDKVTKEMYSRAICIKIWLWIAAIALFAALIAGVIYRVNKITGNSVSSPPPAQITTMTHCNNC